MFATPVYNHHGMTKLIDLTSHTENFLNRKEYTEWRTDHSVALQCHCCNAMFTVKHVGKSNLLADNAKVHSTS